MRLKGKLKKWNEEKAFGFITPNGGGDKVLIHKTAFSNRQRSPCINDVITFSITKDKQGRYCADEATFSGEQLKKKQAKSISMFSIYLSFTFLVLIAATLTLNYIPKNVGFFYFGASIVTFIAYALDKFKAERNTR
jgi:cold shock CspA family protein